jgi:hypothetical protein
VAEQSKARVFGSSLAGVAGSNPKHRLHAAMSEVATNGTKKRYDNFAGPSGRAV